MKKRIFLILLAISLGSTYAQSNRTLFEEANTFYKEGQYQKAIDSYRAIEKNDSISSTLYYNLGNCYYKLNEVANTIYNYEKALLINPLNSDAANNLIIAKKLTIDRIESLPQTLLQKINHQFLKKLSFNQWAWLSVIFSVLGAILFLLFYFSSISNKKRIYFVSSILSFLLLATSLTIAYNQYQLVKNKKIAIVFSTKSSVKNAPTENSDEIFELHEGTKVQVLDKVDSWKKIQLADGKVGWIDGNDIKIVAID